MAYCFYGCCILIRLTGGVAWGADSAKVERQQDRQIEWGEQVCSSKSEQAQKKGRCCQAACLDFAAGMAKAQFGGGICVCFSEERETYGLEVVYCCCCEW